MSIKKPMLDPRQFLQPDAHFPYRTQLSSHPVLPTRIHNFFSQQQIPKDFHPFHPKYTSLIHIKLKEIADNFELFGKNHTLNERIKTAEAIAQEIRNTVPSMAPLYEIAARYHLTCRLLKMQSDLPAIQLNDIGNIYNFMTVENSFILPEKFIYLVLRQNLIPRIASKAADRWNLRPSMTENLTSAEKSISQYVQSIKKIISHSHLEEQDWHEIPADNEDIDSLLSCLDAALRNAFAQKLIMHISLPCKAAYAQTGALPTDIAATLGKIIAFLNHSDARMRSFLAVPCDPAKDLVAQLFDTRKSKQRHFREIEQDARANHARIDQRLFSCIFPCLTQRSHAKIDRVKNNKLAAVSWAEKQYFSAKPIHYPLVEPILVDDASLFSDFAPRELNSPSVISPLDFLTS